MKSVNVAELKNKLSAYLEEVEKGEEVVVKNRRKAVARILPVDAGKSLDDDWALAAEGKLRMPEVGMTKKFLDRFLAYRMPPVTTGTSVEAVVSDRDED